MNSLFRKCFTLTKCTKGVNTMKYHKFNLLQPELDIKIRTRRYYYREMFNLLKKDESEFLYTLLYSRYCTTKYMVAQICEEPENEENIPNELKKICKKEYMNKSQFEEEYMNCLKRYKNEDIFKEYYKINKKILSRDTLSETERIQFYEGTSSTDSYINKLYNTSYTEYIKKVLLEWNSVNSWITSIGVFMFGGFIISHK